MKYFHTAFAVTNLDKSKKFYEEVFGLKARSVNRRDELKARFVYLEDEAHNVVVELFEHDNPLPLKDNLMDFQVAGLKHLAFTVDDLELAVDKAVQVGAKIIWPIKSGITVKRIAFIGDPDGIPIELVEPR